MVVASEEKKMDFRISGLPALQFQPLFAMTGAQLEEIGARRCYADDSMPGYPCRVSLMHAKPGEELILTSFQHQNANSPYRASGPIFVRKNATETFTAVNTIPDQLRVRLLSIRAYDSNDQMVDAEVVEGANLETALAHFFAQESVAYLHVHNARRGCYACRIDRA
jgi:hypothetical protein